MLKKLLKAALGKDLEIREKMFRMIILLGSALSVVGITECMILVDTRIIVVPLLIMLCILLIAMYATFRYGKFEFSAVLVGLMLVAVVFPAMFFLSGGILGGASVWFVLEIFYIFVLFSGRKLVAFLSFSILANGAVYFVSSVYPELVRELQSDSAAFVDSYFAISIVGIAGGLLLKYQMRLFETERAITLSQKEELEKASNSKDAFFANISHEIRTPINAIIGLDEMILRESGEEEIREYAGNIQSAGRMLLNLVNDILDMSKMEAKKMEIIPAEYKTQTLFEELIDIIQVRMREKKLEFFVDIDENLPTTLIGDEKRIKQVLLNILTNAVKYTESGSVTLTVRSEPLSDDAVNLKVSVADTGMGIRKEDLEYLFESFRRVNDKKITNIEGSGLGMSIVKQLLDLMGGEITVDSIYKKGSVFTVILRQEIAVGLPIGKVHFQESEGEKYYRYRQSFEAPDARVLIVDDNEMNAMVTRKLLTATRVQVDMARNGMECLKKTKQKYYHVILMDYMMPEMNGAETLKELRKQENGLCRESSVIVLTANTLSDARKLYEVNRFDGYLEKPIQSAMLEAEIMRLLPEEIIEYSEDAAGLNGKKTKIQQISGGKRKNIYITSDCVCDLPEELLEKYDIKQVHLYVRTKRGRFADTKEIDSGSMSMYLTEFDGEICAESVSVEEYEAFFSETLSQADHVIHISMAAGMGKTYHNASAAAKGFNHVHVIDSGQISCGEGMIVLYAAKLAAEGYHTGDICAKIEKMKHRVMAGYLLPGIDLYYRNGFASRLIYLLDNYVVQLHPVLGMKQSRAVIRKVRFGNLQGAWKRQIHSLLWNKRKINTDVVMIAHVGCSVSQQEMLKREVLKCVPFERVIVQKTSLSVACNAGMGAIGISYYLNE